MQWYTRLSKLSVPLRSDEIKEIAELDGGYPAEAEPFAGLKHSRGVELFVFPGHNSAAEAAKAQREAAASSTTAPSEAAKFRKATEPSEADSSKDSDEDAEQLGYYLAGIPLHTYWRRVGMHSDKCDHRHCGGHGEESDADKNATPDYYTLCDTCIGTTDNGVYDVGAMIERPAEVNLRHVCLRCYADDRRDLGPPHQDLPVVNRRRGTSSSPAARLAGPSQMAASVPRRLRVATATMGSSRRSLPNLR